MTRLGRQYDAHPEAHPFGEKPTPQAHPLDPRLTCGFVKRGGRGGRGGLLAGNLLFRSIRWGRQHRLTPWVTRTTPTTPTTPTPAGDWLPQATDTQRESEADR